MLHHGERYFESLVEQSKMNSMLIEKLAIVMLVAGLLITASKSQTPTKLSPTPQWQIAAGGKMKFDAASLKLNKNGGDSFYTMLT